MEKRILLILSTILLSLSSVVYAIDVEILQYRIRRMPISQMGCTAKAKELSARFATATGQTVYNAICERSDAEGYDILISYYGKSLARYVSTINEDGRLSSNGIYRSLVECQKALPIESNIFENATGLTPFVAYCFRESPLSKLPYFARIDAWGDAKAYPDRFEGSLFASSIDNANAVLKDIRDSAIKMSLPVYQVSFGDDSGLALVVRYYANPLEPRSEKFKLNRIASYKGHGSVSSLNACRQQLSEAKEGFSRKYSAPGIWLCANDAMVFETSLYLLRIQPLEWIKTVNLPDRYSTYEECRREFPSRKAWYQEAFGVTPFAAVCSWKNGLFTGTANAYLMRVLTKSLEIENPFELDPDLGP